MHQAEYNSEIEKFIEVAKRSIKRGEIPDMEALEQGMREVAFRYRMWRSVICRERPLWR